ncbi:exodeoxyribonuclease V subunit gamma [Castellaniella sp.]|uniref:exodeoxyribonuclease V subunit gamma n=1 Tax=Castellaniella sp. TaxID=1955812 RepID=UPI0035641A6B
MDPAEPAAGLMLLHGNRPEVLREVLIAWLRAHPLGPLENETILVHSNGIAQWLRLAVAEQGVAAALDFVLPARFVWQAYRVVLGPALVPEESPLDKASLLWRLMRLLPEWAHGLPTGPLDAGVEATRQGAGLRQFLADPADVRKRYQLAWRLADLYDQYQVYRADWLDAWARGRMVLPDGRGGEVPLPPGQRWQAQLWQAVLAECASTAPVGRAAIHHAFMQQLADPGSGCRPAGLPRRIVVFGISSLPLQVLEALASLARWAQVVVCVHNPCRYYWADIQGERELLRRRFRRQRHRDRHAVAVDEALLEQGQPLLASWGRQGRDFVAALDDHDDPEVRARFGHEFAALQHRMDLFESPGGATLLAQLQDDILELRSLPESRSQWPAVDVCADGSIRFQMAYSAQREVEALHDQLLAAFAADPTLQPRDVIVMVPRIEEYAASVQAVFGVYRRSDWRHVPYTLADRGEQQADPLLIVLRQLLQLPECRLGVGQLFEWLDVPALRARFGLREDQLPLLRRWVQRANVRWGLDAGHKALFDLGQDVSVAQRHTWLFGLQRLVLGYAVGQDAQPWLGMEPCAEAGGLEAEALGGLAQLLDTLLEWLPRLQGNASVAEWVNCFRRMLDACFEPVCDEDERTLERFRGILEDWRGACALAAFDDELPVAVALEHCFGQLDRAGLSQRFFGGAVTFATLMPMRAIPFRRVYMLGINDGDFPRRQWVPDFDLMAVHPRAGDRLRREEDRYLFLEALLSAREHLCISWVARDIRDNTERPPSVLVAQLRTHLDRGWALADGRTSVSDALTVRHPLQPFSLEYFPSEPGMAACANDPRVLWTYAAEWRQPAMRAANQAAPAGGTAGPDTGPDAGNASAPVRTLSELQRFLRQPLACFLQHRLQVSFPSGPDLPEDTEPYDLDGLQRWQLLDGLLSTLRSALLSSNAPDAPALLADGPDADLLRPVLERLRRAGDLPDAALGDILERELLEKLAIPLERCRAACRHWPEIAPDDLRIQQTVTLSSHILRVEGRLGGWRCDPAGQWARIHLLASGLVKGSGRNPRYDLRHALSAWVEHVAGHVQGRAHHSLLISPKGAIEFEPLESGQAREIWHELWRAWVDGMQAPMPVEADTALTWLRQGASRDPDSPAYVKAQACFAARAAGQPVWRRYYPDFDALCAHDGFFDAARRLYGALDDAVRRPGGTERPGVPA